MSETTTENAAPARPVKFKSNAPWLLGLIALLFAIPNLWCHLQCNDVSFMKGSGFESFMVESFYYTLGMFVLSLFGKSKLSAITGILIVAGALLYFFRSMSLFQLLGCIEGGLFFFAGIFSIMNRINDK